MEVSKEFLEDVAHGTFSQRSEFVKMLAAELNHHPANSNTWEVIVDYPERMQNQTTAVAEWPASTGIAKTARNMPVWFERNAVHEVLSQLVSAVVKGISVIGWQELMPGTVKVCVIRTNSLEVVYMHEFNQVKATVVYEVQG